MWGPKNGLQHGAYILGLVLAWRLRWKTALDLWASPCESCCWKADLRLAEGTAAKGRSVEMGAMEIWMAVGLLGGGDQGRTGERVGFYERGPAVGL